MNYDSLAPVHRVKTLVVRYLKSDSLRVTVWIGAGGVGLTGANLLLAGVLDPDAFGRLTLFQALLSVAVKVGAFGFDALAVRNEIPQNWSAITQVGVVALLIAGVVSVVALGGFGLSFEAAGCLFGGIVAGAIATLSASYKQGQMQLDQAQAILQLPFVFFLLVAGGLALATEIQWVIAGACLAGGYVAAAAFGLTNISLSSTEDREEGGSTEFLMGAKRWRRAGTFLAIGLSGFVLLQIERLAIPRLLSYADLAVFGVAWTVVGSPFKLLQSGIGFALFPKLRSEESQGQVRGLLARELKLAGLLGVGGGAILVAFGGPVIDLLYGGKYAVSLLLLLVVVLAGIVRLLFGVAAAAVSGLGEAKELRIFNWSGWLALGVAAVAIVALSSFGLVGIVLGATLGWCIRIGAAAWVVKPLLKHRSAPSSATS